MRAGDATVRDQMPKSRAILAALFRHWGNALRYDARETVLKGAPDDWPRDPRALASLDAADAACVPFDHDELYRGVGLVARTEDGGARIAELLDACKDIATPYRRDREGLFKALIRKLLRVYKDAVFALLDKHLPLVIVDEAHNWKNKKNGYRGFGRFIGPRTRRLLLLTATPFQLRPAEMLNLLELGDDLMPAPSYLASEKVREDARRFRDHEVRPAVERAAAQSRRMARAWARLGEQVTVDTLAAVWSDPALVAARDALESLAEEVGALDPARMQRLIDGAVAGIDPAVRTFFREALAVYALNRDVSHELGRLVIRHRRRTDHRLVRVGAELTQPVADLAERPGRSVLHAAPGVDVRGDGELPHYLLMRAVAEMKGQGRTALGSDLTGCYSTLLHSADGQGLQRRLAGNPVGQAYVELLLELVDADQDPAHPKVRAVVDQVVESWRAGEKTLVFCFRTNTAQRLQDILKGRLEAELDARRQRCLGGEAAWKALRSRLTARNRDLIGIGLDRVLWSLAVARPDGASLDPRALALTDDDLEALAACFVRHGIDPREEHPDRVFLHRAHEHVVARRLLGSQRWPAPVAALLTAMADPSWVEHAYGLPGEVDDDSASTDRSVTDERGVHFRYPVVVEDPPAADVAAVVSALRDRRARARQQGQTSMLDAYVEAPNLWLGLEPGSLSPRVSRLHAQLAAITFDDELALAERREVMQALRRAVFRESMLLRMLPDRDDRGADRWDTLLVDAFFRPLPGQREGVADRVVTFLEDLRGASGRAHDPETPRGALLDATRQKEDHVALVSGSTKQQTRDRRFTGFNTPLLPEVMVCTSVGQEGIDLHRHCRNVIHYDLAWNPAVVEQRTGRVDRIGSKAFRERALKNDAAFLEIALPYLAGTYDERMYAELRIRAQIFEVLTGGDVTADDVTGSDEAGAEAQGQPADAGLPIVSLPPGMIEALRVKLEVYEPSGPEDEALCCGDQHDRRRQVTVAPPSRWVYGCKHDCYFCKPRGSRAWRANQAGARGRRPVAAGARQPGGAQCDGRVEVRAGAREPHLSDAHPPCARPWHAPRVLPAPGGGRAPTARVPEASVTSEEAAGTRRGRCPRPGGALPGGDRPLPRAAGPPVPGSRGGT